MFDTCMMNVTWHFRKYSNSNTLDFYIVAISSFVSSVHSSQVGIHNLRKKVPPLPTGFVEN